MSHPLVIRPAQLADLPALIALEQRCFSSDLISERALRRFITGGRADVIVAQRGTVTVGYALVIYRAGAWVARLYSIAVDPAVQGQGIAAQLVEAAIAAARARGMAQLSLEVAVTNTRARALYDRFGFAPYQTLPEYCENGEAALRLRAPILANALS